MIAPPFLLGGALLFWGWQTAMWLPALVLAIVLESVRYAPWRFPFSDKDFARIADFSTLLLLALAAYQFILGHFPQALFLMLEWLPLVLSPLMGAQICSLDNQLKLSALFISLRDNEAARTNIRMDSVYFSSCLLGAAAANVQTPWFYSIMSLLLAWALWSIRPAQKSLVSWSALLILAIGLGYAGHVGLFRLQSQVQEAATEWFTDFFGSDTDPFQSSTQIGKIGRIKLSDQIVLRVKPSKGQAAPRLLRDAAYNTYISGTWLARPQSFQSINTEENETSWLLSTSSSPAQTVEISQYSKRGKAVIVLPLGTFRVSHLSASELEVNVFGGVKVSGVPGTVIYQAQFSDSSAGDALPTAADRQIPSDLSKTLSTLAAQLRLDALPPKDALAAIKGYFAENFKYTLFLGDAETGPRQLEEFLLRSHVGHCEYFATATVLLLRKAGIPARYATGYSVQEFSSIEDRYVVRARHAHAWVLAYIDGRWREIDTTPSSWASIEEQRESIMQPLYDLGSWLFYRISLLRMNGMIALNLQILIPPFILLVAILAWRLKKKRQITKRDTREKPVNQTYPYPWADSPFYRVMEHLNSVEIGNEETLKQWINRIESADDERQRLHELLELHYRYRFDPLGLGKAEKSELFSLSAAWLQREAMRTAPK